MITHSLGKISTAAFTAVLFVASIAHAGVLLDPVSASTDMGQDLNANNVRSQAGLSPGYTSGVTDLNAYLSLNPIHNGTTTITAIPPVTGPGNIWTSAGGHTTGNFDFDLGGSHAIDAFLFWDIGLNTGNIIQYNVTTFTLLAADNAAFTDPITLGNFTANPNSGDWTAVHEQVFTFNLTTASYVRMQITGNSGDLGTTAFGQAAFDQVLSVPEPASLALLAASLAPLLRRRRK